MITKNFPLLSGLIVGIMYYMCTEQILLSIGIALAVVIIVALAQWGSQWSYRKNAKRLILKRLEVTTSEESPKPDGKGNSYYIVELKAKRNWLYSLFMRRVSLEIFTKVRFQVQWGEEKGNSFRCSADEITLGLDIPRRLFMIAHNTIAKLAIVKSEKFVLSSLGETAACGQELIGNYNLTILICDNKQSTELSELPCPLCIKEGKISETP